MSCCEQSFLIGAGIVFGLVVLLKLYTGDL